MPVKLPRFLAHVPVPWVFVLDYFVGVGLEFATGRSQHPFGTGFVSAVGAALFALGAALAAWAWGIFYKARTTRVPGRRSSTFVTYGPYRFSRNPMYLGLTLAYLGEAGILRQLWPVLVLPLAIAYVNRVIIPVEEARLKEVFGPAYDDYRARVRRWL